MRQPLVGEAVTISGASVSEQQLLGINDVRVDPQLGEHRGKRRPRGIRGHRKIVFDDSAVPRPCEVERDSLEVDVRHLLLVRDRGSRIALLSRRSRADAAE